MFTDVALLFRIGNAFDSVVPLVAYVFLLKKEKINMLENRKTTIKTSVDFDVEKWGLTRWEKYVILMAHR